MTIGLTGFYPKQYYPEPLRLVRYWDEEQNVSLFFNECNTHFCPSSCWTLQKRWQVELFFKWLKQHLKIKSFEVLPRMPFGYKSTLLYAPTAWSQLFNTTCNWIGARTKFFKYWASSWQIKRLFETSLTKLNCKMTKNDLDQMDQVYLIFNNVPILMGH